MKKIIFVCCLFLLLIASCFLVQYYMDQDAKILLGDLEEINTLLQKENWTQIQEQFTVFGQKWEKEAFWWSMIISHDEIDKVNLLISEMNALLQSDSLPEAKLDMAQNLNELIFWVDHIAGKGNLTSPNFL